VPIDHDDPVLILLPPSEGKSVPARGPALDLAALSLPGLTSARRAVLAALADMCSCDPQRARTVLGLSPRQAPEVAWNAGLDRAPTAPAAEVYTGVLFQALGHRDLDRAARRRLDDQVLVWSGLWGAVRLDDPIPAYRLSASVDLPGIGRLPAFWRPHLGAALAALVADQVVLDLRSSAHASSWRGPPAATVVGRVLHERAGTLAVASHFNKATKGRLVRALAQQGRDPATPEELVESVRAAGFVAAWAPGSGRRPATLDIVVTDP